MHAKEKEDKTKRALPNSQLHHIRESLRRGKKETDAELNLFKHRYSDVDPMKDKGFEKLLIGDSLFFPPEGDEHHTHFLDALDAVDFWKGFDCKENEQPKNVATQNWKEGGQT